MMVCLWTLALNRVLVCRLEWLTLLPLIPDFKQMSHLMVEPSHSGGFLGRIDYRRQKSAYHTPPLGGKENEAP
jgi:hypothetical protein